MKGHERIKWKEYNRGYSNGYARGHGDALVEKGIELDALFYAALLMLNKGRQI